MKTIKRKIYGEGEQKYEFVSVGIMVDGHLAYVKKEDKPKLYGRCAEEPNQYVQVRENGELVMLVI